MEISSATDNLVLPGAANQPVTVRLLRDKSTLTITGGKIQVLWELLEAKLLTPPSEQKVQISGFLTLFGHFDHFCGQGASL